MLGGQYKAYFGKKDIYPSQRGNMSLDEMTNVNNNDNVYDKTTGSSINSSDKKQVALTLVGMLGIIIFFSRGVKK